MAIYKGAGVAIVTPMNNDFSVNFDRLDELIEFQIAEGTDAIIICGTTGEAPTLSGDMILELIGFTVERVKGRIPVIAGTGSTSTHNAIKLSEGAEERGADAALVVTPYYNKATQAGLISHFTAIANSVKIPQILYDVPARTGMTIAPQTMAHLVKNVDNIVALKESTNDIVNVAKIMNYCDGNIDLYSGNDNQVVPLLSLGGIGTISVLSNMAPKYVHDMVMKYLEGDVATAGKMQVDVIPLCDALFCEVSPIPVKAALNLMGKDVGPPRPPLTTMEPQNLEILKKAMKDMGYL